MAGRLVLLKAALYNIPSFWFNLHLIPSTILNSMEKSRRKFLWGSGGNSSNKMHLLRWDRICQAKNRGLGLVPLKTKNLALLAKWWWRIYNERDMLWNQILAQRYGASVQYNLFSTQISASTSHMVRSIINLRNINGISSLINAASFKWKVRNGEKIFFWEDHWFEGGPLMLQMPRLYRIALTKHLSIAAFKIKWNNRADSSSIWSRSLLSRDATDLTFLSSIIAALFLNRGEDLMIWVPGNGEFSTKICSQTLLAQSVSCEAISPEWKSIWNIKAPPKILIFLWKIHKHILPTSEFLGRKLSNISKICGWCGLQDETVHHLFWRCSLARIAWTFIGKWWSYTKELQAISRFSLINIIKISKGHFHRKLWGLVVSASLWSIWLARNECKFSGVRVSEKLLEFLLLERINKWGKAANILSFGNEPLWMSNPHGAIAVHLYKVRREYWDYKKVAFDFVCAVDGAWYVSDLGPMGGIGGQVLNRTGNIIYSFAGPLKVRNSLEAEIEAILHVVNLVIEKKFQNGKMVICSDSTEALAQIRNGLPFYSPIHGQISNLKSMVNNNFFLDFVSRDLNENADSLAKHGTSKAQFSYFWP